MRFFLLSVPALLLAASPAFAAADLAVTLTPPAGPVLVYSQGYFVVQVANVGNQTANNVQLVIELPRTHTSPQVYVLGILSTYSSGCSQSGTNLVCNFGTMKKNTSRTVFYNIALPQSAAPLTFLARASTSSYEPNQSNNVRTHNAVQSFYVVSVNPPRNAHNRHCTGQGLTAFYECTLFPGSISSHDITLDAGGTITFANAPPTFTGSWNQPTGTSLFFQYFDNGVLEATFQGQGARPNCYEGLTTFPGSPYVAPYEVCLQ